MSRARRKKDQGAEKQGITQTDIQDEIEVEMVENANLIEDPNALDTAQDLVDDLANHSPNEVGLNSRQDQEDAEETEIKLEPVDEEAEAVLDPENVAPELDAEENVQEADLQEEGHEGHEGHPDHPEELGAEEASETDRFLRSA